MLGPAHGEFDILLGSAGTFDGDGYLMRLAQAQKVLKTRTESELSWHRDLIDRLAIERFVNAAFLIRRRSGTRPVFTRRRTVSSETTASHYQSYSQWAAAAEAWPDVPPILDARVRRVDNTELRSRSVCGPSGWTVVEAAIATRAPFACELRCPTWLASLLARCDGEVTVRDHLRHFRDIGVIPMSATDAEFALLIGQLADGGFIELEEFPSVA
jgi:hypothetical protein